VEHFAADVVMPMHRDVLTTCVAADIALDVR